MRKAFGWAAVVVVILVFAYGAAAETLCPHYAGPDVSDDLMRLTDFSVTGPSPLNEGGTITVKFTMQNFGQSDLTLGSKGLFAAARDPANTDASFGFSYVNEVLEYNGSRTIEVTEVLDKAGVWHIWPSYNISGQIGEIFGPENWHDCVLEVGEVSQDSDNDGIIDAEDNCPDVSNQGQEDMDQDGVGDACDECDDRDSDGDGIKNCIDQCPNEKETINDYLDEDGCADEVPQTQELKLEMEVVPENPKAGEEFSVSVSALEGDVEKILILVNGIKVKECTTDICAYGGFTDTDDPDIGGIATDSFGDFGYVGDVPWGEIPECVDTDDGDDPYVGGYASNETARFEDGAIILPPMYYDECIDSDTLREYYCDGNAVLSREYSCGRCAQAPELVLPDGNTMPLYGDYCECGETDRGMDAYNQGTANDSFTDYCVSLGRLNEYFCSHGILQEREIRCACELGECRCIDSDGGRNYFTKGRISFDPLGREDGCLNERTLREYYCDSGDVAYEDVSCYMCGLGKCLCEDSDGGINQLVRGTTSVGSSDYCFDSERLVEYSVELHGNSCTEHWQYIDCRDGCSSGECQETCSDGMQNQGEAGIDCGGPCPNDCIVCLSSAITTGSGSEAGQFSIGDSLVATTAREAVMEYTDCLRDSGCRGGLPQVSYFADYSVVDIGYIFSSGYSLHPRHFTTSNVVMEAVAYYVDNHMRYMYDGSDGPVQSARETIEDSGSRSGTICLAGEERERDVALFSKKCDSSTHVDVCPNDYCGDCEDFCHLRGGLMRNLGIRSGCMYCVDHYNGYWGGGHTFNVVLYKGKWRIMDYQRLGDKFLTEWEQHIPHNLYNDARGVYWCPDWKDNLGDGHLDAGCDKIGPRSRTWNYEGGAHCPSSWDKYMSYRTDTCP